MTEKQREKEEKAKERLKAERERLEKMRYFERRYTEMGFKMIGGVDEAGRGPLAGPVVAACVILPRDCEIIHLNDSKKLSPKRREELFVEIKEKARAFGVGIVSNEIIDEINILQATHEAMKKAIEDMKESPDILLVDALKIHGVDIKQVPIVKGDAKSVSIAAASIIAKVTRDHLMGVYDEIYPEYGFAAHKGYGTAAHIEAIRKYGPCSIHRKTFITRFI